MEFRFAPQSWRLRQSLKASRQGRDISRVPPVLYTSRMQYSRCLPVRGAPPGICTAAAGHFSLLLDKASNYHSGV
jgi:hypothetical protein